MKIVELVNHTPEWHDWRSKGVGSSDAPVIMGVSRFKKAQELLIEKATGKKFEDGRSQYIKDRGNRVEGFVREVFENETGVKFPALYCEHPDFSFMHASLDGIDIRQGRIIEIKLLSRFDPEKPNTETEGFKKWTAAKEHGTIPVDYLPQLHHQLLVTGAKKCTFIGLKEIKGKYKITLDDLAIVDIYPEMSYHKLLAEREFNFWYEVSQKRRELKYNDKFVDEFIKENEELMKRLDDYKGELE